MKYNIIGDIASRYTELMLLLKKMPKGYIVAVGDLVDRGSQAKETIEFFMSLESQGKGTSLMGNHEHMMLDYCLNSGCYQHGIWLYNGGQATLDSFSGYIPEEVLDWISRRPYYKKIQLENQEVVISHSFVHPYLELKEAVEIAKSNIPSYHPDFDNSIIWNRKYPIQRNYLQIVGHNSPMKLREFKDKGTFAICLDDSRNKKLTGLHLKSDGSYEVSQVGYQS